MNAWISLGNSASLGGASMVNTSYYQLALVNNDTVIYSYSIDINVLDELVRMASIGNFHLGECPYALHL